MTTHSLKKKTIHLLAVTVLATSSIGGAALIATPTVNAATVSTSQIKISEKTAVKKFNKRFKNIDVDEIQLETKGNKYQYEISGADNQKEYTAYINAKSGKVTSAHSGKLDNGKQKAKLDLNKLITRKQANKIAEKAVKNSKGQSWTLENENGTPVWEVEVVKGQQTTTVKINAQNKQVISTKNDD